MNINDAALRKLGSRNRTVWEMRKYLQTKDFEEAEIENLIKEYLNCGYLNDSNYCHEYFNYAFGKLKAPKRVFAELKEKGVEKDVIQIAYESIEEKINLVEMAKKAAAKSIGDAEITEKILGRVSRKLMTLGYPSDVVYSVIGQLMQEK